MSIKKQCYNANSDFATILFCKFPLKTVLRKLNEFESPYISIKWLDESHRIVFRKWYAYKIITFREIYGYYHKIVMKMR